MKVTIFKNGVSQSYEMDESMTTLRMDLVQIQIHDKVELPMSKETPFYYEIPALNDLRLNEGKKIEVVSPLPDTLCYKKDGFLYLIIKIDAHRVLPLTVNSSWFSNQFILDGCSICCLQWKINKR